MSRGPARTWYSSARWQHRRALQLANQPLCVMCLEKQRYTAATVADHVKPHRGDFRLFWDGELQSLCKRCHDSDKALIEAGKTPVTIGDDGWPVGGGSIPRAAPL